MRFLVDECTGPSIACWQREQRHDVFSVYEDTRGMNDEEIIRKAFVENWIIITNDRHFGGKVYREQHEHHGVVLLRLEDERADNKIGVLHRLLEHHAERLPGRFVVVTESQIRFAGAAH